MIYLDLVLALERMADDKADGQDVSDRLNAASASMVEAWGDLTRVQSRDLFARVESLGRTAHHCEDE